MRPIWSGTISFGLVSVPVRMFPAAESKELRFHFLHKKDLTPIAYEKVRRDDREPVDLDEIVRGFEIEKGRYVPLEDEDLDRLDVELTHSIDICDFVSLDEIDPVYFRKAYYLLPAEGAEKPYRLLVRALEETGRVAIAKVVIRNKQHLAAVRPYEGVLLLETMYYADEVRKPQCPRRRARHRQVAEDRGRAGQVSRRESERDVRTGEVRRPVPQGVPGPDQGEGERPATAGTRRGARGGG